MFGALIPFLLLFVRGFDRLLGRFGNTTKFAALGLMLSVMLGFEIATDWPVFYSQYNWYHM
jgi:p-aminobenzoyl-glutamate transporter AbgT